MKFSKIPLALVAMEFFSFAEAADDPHRKGLMSCGPLPAVNTQEGHIDYRFRNSSEVVRKGIRDLDYYHTRLALDDMRAGNYGGNVIANLAFTLRHCPNHHVGLQTLIQFESFGGKVGTFPQVECFLNWALEFAPDDPAVHLLGGYYFWKAGEGLVAKKWYMNAVELDPDSMDAHYNLGLLYLELADYEASRKHAQIAYDLGHPLPGLRETLIRLGHWSAMPPTEFTLPGKQGQ